MLQVTKLNPALNKVPGKIHLKGTYPQKKGTHSSLLIFLFLDLEGKSCQILLPVVSQLLKFFGLSLYANSKFPPGGEDCSPLYEDQYATLDSKTDLAGFKEKQ